MSEKKSIKNIAGPHASPSDIQSLRQFINQSTWSWKQVAESYSGAIVADLLPELWVLDSVFIRKRGCASVGASRWFVRRSGRTMNGQMAVALFLSSRKASVPVGWRILVRGPWIRDSSLRRAAGVPAGYRLEHGWEAAIDLVDSTIRNGVLPRRPITADFRGLPGGHRLIDELAERGIEFLIEVDSTVLPAGYSAAGRPGTVTSSVAQRVWAGDSQSLIRVITENPGGAGVKTRYWMTNVSRWDVRLLKLSQHVLQRHAQDVKRLERAFGVRDFVGRSFGGWHRHLSLVSAAFAFSILEDSRTFSQSPEESYGIFPSGFSTEKIAG